MQNVGNKRKATQELKHNLRNSSEKASFLSLYTIPPANEISLDEFESYAIDRLRVLKTIEMQPSKASPSYKQFQNKMSKTLALHLPNGKKDLDKDKLKDNVSHFILRMAFCQSEELRRWFLAQESNLFRYRLDKLQNEEKMMFMRMNGLDYEQASDEDIASQRLELKMARDAWCFDVKERNRPLGVYFKLPFTQALDLIATRKVFLTNGIAYVPMEHLVSILFARFRSNMSRALSIAYQNLSHAPVSRDERLVPVLKNLSTHHVGANASVTTVCATDRLVPSMINGLAKTSMPLCMQRLHATLRSSHHLKYTGRMQYGLFLKGMGMQMEDALAFWKMEFCKKMSVDDFNKRYSYNIRHNYGKEGKRKDYTPFTCARIITGDAPKAGDAHGCPFRHYDEVHLKKALGNNIDRVSKDEIMTLVKTKQYQIACRRHFEATHKGANSDAVGNHPNHYTEESRKFYDAQKDTPVVME